MCLERYSGGSELLIIGELFSAGQTLAAKLILPKPTIVAGKTGGQECPLHTDMSDGLERLKILINSSTPIIVMERSEEVRAVSIVRAACSEFNMATFEWSIADGLLRSGASAAPSSQKMSVQAGADQAGVLGQISRMQAQARTVLSPGGGESDRLARAMMSALGAETRALNRQRQHDL